MEEGIDLFTYLNFMRIFNRKALEKRREAILWNYLKHSKLAGRKFRRQTSIKNFIVDFYCPEE